MTLASIFAAALVFACLLVCLVAMASFSIRTAPVTMLAPPQARRWGQAAATKKEAVNTHSNARFGREVEWNVNGNDCF